MQAPGANRSFADLLAAFTQAIVANDGAGLGALFAEGGIYADEFFGAHRGRAAIAAMLQRFHDTGSDSSNTNFRHQLHTDSRLRVSVLQIEN